MEAVGGVDASDKEIKAAINRWLGFWLDHFSVVQARFTARAVYNRASACGRTPQTRPSGTTR